MEQFILLVTVRSPDRGMPPSKIDQERVRVAYGPCHDSALRVSRSHGAQVRRANWCAEFDGQAGRWVRAIPWDREGYLCEDRGGRYMLHVAPPRFPRF